ncbi:MAG: hypothetical protein EOO07_37860, partial [Chitinophagaceae bacterium]
MLENKESKKSGLRISYLSKMLFLLIGLVIVLETLSYIATKIVVRNAVTQNAKSELVSGGDIFSRLFQNKAEQLALSVAVLTDDFGFKDAVTSNDENTIHSALENHAARVKADIAILITQEGKLISSKENFHESNIAHFNILHKQAESKGRAYDTVIIDDKAYQFVIYVVKAPMPVGYAGMGFEIKKEFSNELKKLTNLEVSFVRYTPTDVTYLGGTLDRESQLSLEKNFYRSKQGVVFEYDQKLSLI